MRHALAALCLVVAGCSGRPRALPTTPFAGGACAGVGLVDAVLHGSPDDPQVTWLDVGPAEQRHRMDVLWPAGYTARFGPALQVMDAAGKVRYREGDLVDGGCPWSDGDGTRDRIVVTP